MADVTVEIGATQYSADFLLEEAPETVEQFRNLLPLESSVKHVRWSGYAIFLEDFPDPDPDFTHLPRENHCVYPSRGDILFYPGYKNPPEILIACGSTGFRSPAGELAGNHFAVLTAPRSDLAALEVDVLENGSKPIRIDEA